MESKESLEPSLLETQEEINFDINLRSSCLDCQFLNCCVVSEKKGTPRLDVLIGTYRASALKKKCLI
ncbi:MAG: hypothetical protein ACYCQJ_03480 [Nitrososphaerales archaeon]